MSSIGPAEPIDRHVTAFREHRGATSDRRDVSDLARAIRPAVPSRIDVGYRLGRLSVAARSPTRH